MTQSSLSSAAEVVVNKHLASIEKGVDAILADYTEDSVIFTQLGPLSGLSGIRAFFEGMLQNSPPELFTAFTVVRLDARGDYAYLVWKAEPFIPLATDSFFIKNGKILVQTFTAFGA